MSARDAIADDPITASIERADDNTASARAAIKAIPKALFGEREVAALLEALQERVSASNWSHRTHAHELGDVLTEAHLIVENAADVIALECAA